MRYVYLITRHRQHRGVVQADGSHIPNVLTAEQCNLDQATVAKTFDEPAPDPKRPHCRHCWRD